MCGICGGCFASSCCETPSPAALLSSIAHRGPDGSTLVQLSQNSFLGFARLSLVGATSQPMIGDKLAIACNGEIYNHEELRLSLPQHLKAAPSAAASDCSVLAPCIDAWGIEKCLMRLDGMFALAAVAVAADGAQDVYLARDRMGVKPLLWGLCAERRCLAFGSEARALPASWRVTDVAPGFLVHIRISSVGAAEIICDAPFLPPWSPSPQRSLVTTSALRIALVASVEAQLMGDRPVGVLLSGGLDSSIVAAIAARIYRQRGATPLRAFTISHEASAATAVAPASADLVYAQQAAAFVGAELACFTFSTAEAMAALSSVVGHLESFDVGLVRVAVPLYLLAKKVAACGVRAVLVGEGADEAFGGYALFRAYGRDAVPAFQRELERRLAAISVSELLRVDRCTMAAGVEARVPFLDAAFLSLAMHDSCAERKLSHPAVGRLEKCLLRDAFTGWLPDDVLFRRKEGMADGVGFEWVREVQREAVLRVGIADPDAAEAALYRRLFCDFSHPTRVALAEARATTRNVGREVPLAALISGSAVIRESKSVRDDPQLRDLFSSHEAAAFCKRALGVDVAAQPPSLALLNALIEAALQRVPFHNFALLTRPRVPPTREEVRDDWLRGLGGTCAYTSPAFAAILSSLGFHVFLVACAVRVEFDHLALLVLVAGRFYYVDIGNGKLYYEAALLGDSEPLYSPGSSGFAWRLRWDAVSSLFHVVHGRQDDCGEMQWEAAPSIIFDPRRLVHYSFFFEHFARGRLNPSNIFLHALRFAMFPRLGGVTIRDAQVTFGSTRHATASEDSLMSFARSHLHKAHFAWLQEALSVLRAQGDLRWWSV